MYLLFSTHLWDDGKSAPEIMKPQCGDVNTIDDDSTLTSFNDAKQAVGQTGFACTSSTNNANLSKIGGGQYKQNCLSGIFNISEKYILRIWYLTPHLLRICNVTCDSMKNELQFRPVSNFIVIKTNIPSSGPVIWRTITGDPWSLETQIIS